MSEKPSSRIRPLARRLDSLSGSPTSRPAIRPRASPKPVSSVSSSSASSVAGDAVKTVKDEDISVRDMLAQARLRESKLEVAPAPALRMKKQVIRSDIEGSRKLGYGEGVFFSQNIPTEDSPEGVSIDATEHRCYPVKVPFDVSNTVDESMKESLVDNHELFLVQLPGLFPTLVPPTVEGSPAHPTGRRRGPKAAQAPSLSATTGTPFSEIPDGRVGTWKVHKSGKIVMHVGTTQFQVTEGQKVNFRTEIACVCPSESEIMFLCEATKRLVISPIIS